MLNNGSKNFTKTRMQQTKSNFQVKLNTSPNNFTTNPIDINQTMKVKFDGSNNAYSDIVFNKTSSAINPDIHIKPTDEDIYYDEIIFYDGGDVHGYGYD